jgi:hypothetical protein
MIRFIYLEDLKVVNIKILIDKYLNILANYFNDLHMIQLYSMNIKEIEFKNSVNSDKIVKPKARSNHSCIVYSKKNKYNNNDNYNNNNDEKYNISYGDHLIIYGGNSYGKYLGDVWDFKIEMGFNSRYKRLNTIGNPNPTSEHSAEIHENYMIVIGGRYKQEIHDDIRILNLYNLNWKRFKKRIDPEKIFMRVFHSCCILDKKIYIFSGCNDDFICKEDMIIIDLKNFKFEGIDNNEWIDNDTEIIDYKKYFDNCGFYKKNENLNSDNSEVFCFKKNIYDKIDYKNEIHKAKKLSKNFYPFSRWGSNFCVKDSENLILFGGRNRYDYCDIWIFNIKTKNWLEVN